MPWFTSKGQILQVVLALLAVLYAARVLPSMSRGDFFSAGALLLYLLVTSVLVSTWLTLRQEKAMRSGRRAMLPLESSRIYTGMTLLVLLSWGAVTVCYYDRHSAVPNADPLVAWGVIPGGFAFSSIETGHLISDAKDYYLILAIRVANNQVERVFDRTIEKSEAFVITGKRVSIVTQPSEAFLARAEAGRLVQYFVLLMPRAVSPEQILSLADVETLGGRIVADAASEWVVVPK